MYDAYLALIALGAPLGVVLVLTVVTPLRNLGMAAALACVAGTLVSGGASSVLLARLLEGTAEPFVHTVPWLLTGGSALAEVGVRVDGISVSMLGVVALVAFCVQVFSIGYLRKEPGPSRGRYFTYQALFLFSMNLLVLSPNLLQLFVGWELVGTVSYLLIGYYFTKPSAARAAVKAFWLTKFADMGLLLGLIVLFAQTGSFGWESVLPGSVATFVAGAMFFAVVGKSAQFPLHVWLPDAMEGPTPVSALLHAATMVAAGVFLIVRAEPLFEQAPLVRSTMVYLGAFTALFAAVIALFQNDIKRVLAYSTCSQLGYMIAGLGAGSLLGGYFHLTTHAFFKALLFLAAGSIIHAVHSNDLRKMGGLARRMPVTATVFAIGALALAGIPGFAGFFSKDVIIEAVASVEAWIPAGALLAAAFVTAFYMGRVMLLAFFGTPSAAAAEAKEAEVSMTAPLVVLAIPSLALGYSASRVAGLWGAEYQFHVSAIAVVAASLAVGGFAGAWLVYGKRALPGSVFVALRPFIAWIDASWVDRFYLGVYRSVLIKTAEVTSWFDRYIVDGLINVLGTSFVVAARRLRVVQTGYVQDYVFAVATGVVALAVWGMWQ